MAELPHTADVVVVGGGVHGASVAYHLARRKAGRVLLLERKFLASGPTGRSSALVRRFYAMDFLTRTGPRRVPETRTSVRFRHDQARAIRAGYVQAGSDKRRKEISRR